MIYLLINIMNKMQLEVIIYEQVDFKKMSSNAEKLYKLIANDSKKKQSLFMTALTNPKKALDKICDIGSELNISVTKAEVIEYLSTIDDEATKMWLIKARGGLQEKVLNNYYLDQ